MNLAKYNNVEGQPDFIREFALSLDRTDADAIFMSCGCQRRSKNRPCGGAKVCRLGWVRSLSP